MVEIMSTGSPKWHQFLNQLDEALVIDDDEESGEFTTTCDGTLNRPITREVLADMGFSDDSIEQSLDWMSINGGNCDCECLFNCGLPDDAPEEE